MSSGLPSSKEATTPWQAEATTFPSCPRAERARRPDRETFMNFKRGRPKSSRAGCLLCKPHKRQGACLHERDRFSDRRRKDAAEREVRDFRCDAE